MSIALGNKKPSTFFMWRDFDGPLAIVFFVVLRFRNSFSSGRPDKDNCIERTLMTTTANKRGISE